jgi:DNA-binding NarL/FixJ family response regulator
MSANSNKTILSIGVSIIEDDPPARQILAGWINKAKGFHCVSEHANAASALLELPQEKPDIILVDINLPDISGIQCVERLKPLLTGKHFVMLTVYEDTDHIFNALAAGATGYLLKETSRDQLIASLKEVHEGGSPMSSYIARKVVQSFQRQPAENDEFSILGAREKEVLELLTQGYYYKEIADSLGISMPTVNTYIQRIYDKLHVRSRARAVAKYTKSSRGQGPARR